MIRLSLMLVLLGSLLPGVRLRAATPAAARHGMVVAANPLAAQAGLDVLKAGGSAADAAVAVQAVLGLVEPQSSGVGGGAFISYYDAATRRVRAINGRETAPAGATPDMFLDANGKPLPFPTAVLSGRATGVPGAFAALALLQHEHGRLAWRDLFGAGERLATRGFTVSARLAHMITLPMPQANAPDAVRYFSKTDGTRYQQGDTLKNPAYARTLRRLASQGAAALYRAPLAQDIIDRVHQGALAGSLTLADFAHYQPIESDALCRPWGDYQVCAPPPPAGGIGVLQALLLLQHTDIASRGPNDADAWVEFGQAERLMYADRDRYVGDPEFVDVPVNGLLDPAYIAARAALIGTRADTPAPAPGQPPGASARGEDHTGEPGGTSEIVIVDADGNVVSMTTTVESVFGSGRMVDGFFLNNQLTDFSFSPLDHGAPAANAVAPNKRPRSAMAPTIVLDRDGHFVAATGSAGGPAIIAYVMKTLVATLDWHLSMQAAVSLPNLVAHGSGFSAETVRMSPALIDALNARGMMLQPGQYEESGLQGILVSGGALTGGSDPRREGVALSF